MAAPESGLKRPKISACLVIYHEEAVLERCLRSLEGVADEVVVVHDGECRDASLEIARRFTDKVFVQPHIGIAESHRLFTIEKAAGEWILQLDADEFLSEELRQAIPDLVGNRSVDGYAFLWPLWDGARYTTKRWPHKPILFRRSRLKYLDFPQEALGTTGRLKALPLLLEHRPTYNNFTWKRFRAKWLPWARIQAEKMLQPYAAIPKYGISATDWPPKLRFLRDHPYLYPLAGLYSFLNTLRLGAWREGVAGWRQAAMWGLYNAAVYREIGRLKRSPIHAQH